MWFYIKCVSQGKVDSRESASIKAKAAFSRQIKRSLKMYPLPVVRKILIFSVNMEVK